MLEALPDVDPGTRAVLVEQMIGLSPAVYPVLEQAFGHKHPQVREGALIVAGKMTAQVVKSLPAFQALLKDPELGVRFEAARIVWRLDAKRDEKQLTVIFKEAAQEAEMRSRFFAFLKVAQPPLRDLTLYELALQHGPADVRLQAIQGMADLGKPSKDLFAPLLELARTDMGQRAKALGLMGRICPIEVKEALPDLISLFEKNQNDAAESELFKLFVQCGADAVNPLVELVKKEKAGAVSKMSTVHNALSRIGAPAVDPVVKLLDSKQAAHPKIALRILGGMGPAAKPAVPRVVLLLNDADQSDAAVTCLGGIGSGARAAAPDLAQFLVDKRQLRSRSKTVDSLIQIFPPVDTLLPVLRKVAEDPGDTQSRLKAAAALWIWEGDTKTLTPVLKNILALQQGLLPSEFWTLLGQLGPEAEPFLPDLFAKFNKAGVNDSSMLRFLSEIAPRVKWQPAAMEVGRLTDFLQEKRPEGSGGYNVRKVDAALALVGFDQEKSKALAVLKEELGKIKTPPIELLDRISALENRVQDIVPELLAIAPRLTYGHQLFYEALWRIDRNGLKEMQADLEKLMRSPSFQRHAHAGLLLRIDAKHPEAWKAFETTLRNPNDVLLVEALRNLESLGETAKHLAPLVEKHLTHANITARQAAAVCLWRITGDTAKTVPVLVAALTQQVSSHGGNELKRMGVSARAAVPEILELAETQTGFTSRMLCDFAFRIDRTQAFAWWSQRDRK
jgi:hypothetical protein